MGRESDGRQVEIEERPLATVIAGPVASGKTTAFRVCEGAGFDQFNVDDRCAELNGGSYQRLQPEMIARASRECEQWIAEHVRQRESYMTESTMRTTIALDQLRAAREAGFDTEVVWVSTGDVEINLKRHLERMADGGREADVAYVREAYAKSMGNLPQVLREVPSVELWDTSGPEAELQVAIRDGVVQYEAEPMKAWAREALDAARGMQREVVAHERGAPERAGPGR